MTVNKFASDFMARKAARFRPLRVQLRPGPRRFAAFRAMPFSLALLVHVKPIKADEFKEKTMTTIDFTLLINALAQLVAAFAKFIRAVRHRK